MKSFKVLCTRAAATVTDAIDHESVLGNASFSVILFNLFDCPGSSGRVVCFFRQRVDEASGAIDSLPVKSVMREKVHSIPT